jgi:23S rRNA pseudouridine2604 synthase
VSLADVPDGFGWRLTSWTFWFRVAADAAYVGALPSFVFYCTPWVVRGSCIIEKVRLSKLLSEQGICSRREADEYIQKGLVSVDGVRITELGTKVFPTQLLKLHREAQEVQSGRVTILLNKPIGYVSGQPEGSYKPAVQLVNRTTQFREDQSGQRFQPSHTRGLAPAGRLDIDSQGLLILTQDGRIAKQLIGADSTVDKEYLVRVQGRLQPNGLKLLNHGLSLDDRVLKPADVRWINDDQLRFVLNEGRKRQIRRMCELVGLKVIGLKRIRIGRIRLGDLPVGQWRYLAADERF